MRDSLKKQLRPLGVHWISELAKEAGLKKPSLRTLFNRGQKLPTETQERLEGAARKLLGVPDKEPAEREDRIVAQLGKILACLEPLAGLPRQLDDLKAEIRRAREGPPGSAGGASPPAP